jgi:hypothetical protein
MEKHWPGMDKSKTPLGELFLRPKKKALVLWKDRLPMERGVSRLMWNLRDGPPIKIIKGEFSYDVLWVMMVLGRKAIAPGQNGIMLTIFKKDDSLNPVPFLEFTDTEFRGILAKQNYSSDWIREAVLKTASIIIDVKNFKGIKHIDEDGTEHWFEYESVGPMVMVDILTQYKKKRGRKAKNPEERRYRVYFTSTFGLNFLENLIREGYSLFPQQVTELPALEQELLISTCGWEKAILTPDQMLQLLRLKKSEKKHRKYMQRKRIKKLLGDLKARGYLESWKLDRRGNYELARPEKYPRPQIN